MAVKGIRVGSSGPSVSQTAFTAPLAESLAGLSKSLLVQGAAKDEQERLAAKEAEAQRRYELDRADTLKYRQDQADRQARLDAIAEEDRKRLLDAETAKRDYLTNFNLGDVRRKTLERDEALNSYVTEQRKLNQEALAQQTLLDMIKSGEIGSGVEQHAKELGLTPDQPILRSELPSGEAAFAILQGLEGNEQFKDRLNKYKTASEALKSETDTFLSSQVPLYREELTATLIQDLVSKGVPSTEAAALAKVLGEQAESGKDLTKLALDRQKLLQKQNEQSAKLAFDVWKELQPTKTSRAGDPTKYSLADADELISTLKVSPSWAPIDLDENKLLNYYKAAVAKGVSPKAAYQALEGAVNVDAFGRDVLGSSADFVESARSFDTLNKSNGDYQDLISKFTPETASYIDPRLENLKAFKGSLEGLINRDVLLPLRGKPQTTTAEQKKVNTLVDRAASTIEKQPNSVKSTVKDLRESEIPVYEPQLVGSLAREVVPTTTLNDQQIVRLGEFLLSNPKLSEQAIKDVAPVYGMSVPEFKEVLKKTTPLVNELSAETGPSRVGRIADEGLRTLLAGLTMASPGGYQGLGAIRSNLRPTIENYPGVVSAFNRSKNWLDDLITRGIKPASRPRVADDVIQRGSGNLQVPTTPIPSLRVNQIPTATRNPPRSNRYSPEDWEAAKRLWESLAP